MEKSIEFLQDMFPLGKDIICSSYESNNRDLDKTISDLIGLCNESKPYLPSYDEVIQQPSQINLDPVIEKESKKRRDSRRNLGKKEWKLVLSKNLPDDFLRVPNEIIKMSASSGDLCRGCAKLSQFNTLTNIKDDSSTAISPSLHSTSSYNTSELENIDTILRRRMQDNVVATRHLTSGASINSFHDLGPTDSEQIQYLDDERLALMLQNQEFLRIVKSDAEFQMALQQDRQETQSNYSYESHVPTTEDDNRSDFGITAQDLGDDYGYARSDVNDPDIIWPDRVASYRYNSAANNDQSEVAKLCKSMGKASRNRLLSLAKRFPSIRRKRSMKSYNAFDTNANFVSKMPVGAPIPGSAKPGGGLLGVSGHSGGDTESTQHLLVDQASCDLISLAISDNDNSFSYTTNQDRTGWRQTPNSGDCASNNANYKYIDPFCVFDDSTSNTPSSSNDGASHRKYSEQSQHQPSSTLI